MPVAAREDMVWMFAALIQTVPDLEVVKTIENLILATRKAPAPPAAAEA